MQSLIYNDYQELCAPTASPRGFGEAVRQDKNVQRPTGFTGATPESRSLFILKL